MHAYAQLRLSSASPEDPAVRGAPSEPADRALLGFVLAVHIIPLVALATGHVWPEGTLGYATAVTVVAGRELVRELVSSWRVGRRAQG
jgi:hypothetical protein